LPVIRDSECKSRNTNDLSEEILSVVNHRDQQISNLKKELGEYAQKCNKTNTIKTLLTNLEESETEIKVLKTENWRPRARPY